MSDRVSPRIQWTVWGGLVLTVLTICVLFFLTKLQRAPATLPVYGQIPNFTLTNQLGQAASLDTFRGNVWIADIIFTRCAGPCPAMTQRMSELQSAMSATEPLKLVTLTTDPAFDTPAVLRDYAERFGADPNRWWFLTGTKAEIGNLATNGLRLTAIEVAPSDRTNEFDLFVHSRLSIVIDKRGQMRAVFDILEPGWRDTIVETLNALLREKYP